MAIKITISGPQGSGKTTLAKKIALYLSGTTSNTFSYQMVFQEKPTTIKIATRTVVE